MSRVVIAPESLSDTSGGNSSPITSNQGFLNSSGLSRLFNARDSPNVLNIRYPEDETNEFEEDVSDHSHHSSETDIARFGYSAQGTTHTPSSTQSQSNERLTKGTLTVRLTKISNYNINGLTNSLKLLACYEDVSLSSFGRRIGVQEEHTLPQNNFDSLSRYRNLNGINRHSFEYLNQPQNQSSISLNERNISVSLDWSSNLCFDVTKENSSLQITLYNGLEEDKLIGIAKLTPETKYSTTNVNGGWYVLNGGESAEGLEGFSQGRFYVYIEYYYKVVHDRKYEPDNFEILKLLGKGTFGQVYQVEKKDTKKLYAMKVISKSHIIRKNEIDHTLNERNILVKNAFKTCPFIVNLKFSFQTNDDLYFVTDFKSGGELFMHLQYCGTFPEHRSRFYAAQLVLALEYLHDNDIIYRDLKPENVLLDAGGNLSLCDFGLSKLDIKGKTRTFCGTTEYLAPEILTEKFGYTFMVDFWGLGILMFEMCCGWSPFKAATIQLIYNNIIFSKIKFPKCDLSQEGRNFIKQLLNRKPSRRLGSVDGAKELKRHPFFREVDWIAMLKREVEPPFIPILDSDKDTAYFDKEFTEIPKEILITNQNSNHNELSNSMQKHFYGFTFQEDSILDENRNKVWFPDSFSEQADSVIDDCDAHSFQGKDRQNNNYNIVSGPLDLHDNVHAGYIPLNSSKLRYETSDSHF